MNFSNSLYIKYKSRLTVEKKNKISLVLSLIDIHIDHNYNVIKNQDLLILKAYPNVIVIPHAAFYTDQVSYDMVHCSLESLKNLVNNQECRYQLN